MDKEFFDVICLGGGGAGLLAALNAAKLGKKVAIISKEHTGYGNTRLAAGMTAYHRVLPEDTDEDFRQDIDRSGEGISEPALVKVLVEKSRDLIAGMEDYGTLVTRDNEGFLSPKAVFPAGGHTKSRTIRFVGGGASLGSVLRANTWLYDITVYNETVALELLKDDHDISGVLVLDLRTGHLLNILAPAVIIATGGCGAIYYPHTTNSRGAVGDGLALALKAGAILWDMEQIQAIPFGVTHPFSMMGAPIGEPITAGPAGKLLNGKGEVILENNIHKMTRAALVKIMMLEIATGRTTPDGGLILDLSPNLKLPEGEKLYQALKISGMFDPVHFAYGKEAYRWEVPWSVLPTMHYLMGGIKVNVQGETNVPGLFAAGEVQAGIHGGNRLGSVGLSEMITFGSLVGQNAAAYSTGRETVVTEDMKEKTNKWQKLLSGSGQNEPQVLKMKLQDIMWNFVGLLRREEDLLKAMNELDKLEQASASLRIGKDRIYNRQILDAIELYHMLPVAKAITLSALERRESRGAHLRLDFAQKDDRHFLCHTAVCSDTDGKIKSGLEKLGQIYGNCQ